MAEDSKLVAFVVNLVVDAGDRERFHGGDTATREQMMSDAGLNDAEKQAIRESDRATLTKLMNIQIVIPTIKKAPVRKPPKKAPKPPTKKKAPKKGGRAKGRRAAKKR
jgi:hypothetical protein